MDHSSDKEWMSASCVYELAGTKPHGSCTSICRTSRQHAEAAVDKEQETQGLHDDKDPIFDEETKEDEDAILDEATKEAVSVTSVPTPTELLQLRILK